jgi:hypothetical protein
MKKLKGGQGNLKGLRKRGQRNREIRKQGTGSREKGEQGAKEQKNRGTGRQKGKETGARGQGERGESNLKGFTTLLGRKRTMERWTKDKKTGEREKRQFKGTVA